MYLEKNQSSWEFPRKISRVYAAAAAKSLQSCPTLCDPKDGSPPGSPVPGILQARTLWVAISFSSAWKWKMKVKSFSHVWLLVTLHTAAYQAPQSMGVSRQEYWNGVSLHPPQLRTEHNHFQEHCRPNKQTKMCLLVCGLWFNVSFPLGSQLHRDTYLLVCSAHHSIWIQ